MPKTTIFKTKKASPPAKKMSPYRSMNELLTMSPAKATATFKLVFLFSVALVDGFYGVMWVSIPGHDLTKPSTNPARENILNSDLISVLFALYKE